MKTKFDGIVKVKKQELDLAESALLKARAAVREIENKIDELLKQIINFEELKNGNFGQMQQQRHMLLNLREQKERFERELISANNRVQNCKLTFEKTNSEYEKMIYLKDNEIATKIKKIKKQEQLDMDEVALQLFAGSMQK